MKFSTMLLIAALGAASAVATAQQTATDPTRTTGTAEDYNRGEHKGDHKHDKISAEDFAKKAGAAGLAEVEMGKLGAQKATDAEVKAFAQKMVTDHSKANKELTTVAKSEGLEVPTDPDMMHKGMMEKFEHQAADKDFNHDYMQQMVRDHKKAVALFQSVANDTTADPEMRALAKKTLPTLEQHLADAQKLEARLAK